MKQVLLTTLLHFFASTVFLAQSPSIEWQKCLGVINENDDIEDYNIAQTTDGGYIISCVISANSGDITGNHGGTDIWVAKLNNNGTIQWKKCFGGSGDEYGTIDQTSDGGYILSGTTESNDGDVSGNHGGYDFWLVKLNNTGIVQWKKCFGGSSEERGQMAITNDGSYIFYGDTDSNDGDISGNHGGFDIVLLKIHTSGAKQWQKCYGGNDSDIYYGNRGDIFIQTTDGGFALSASTRSNNGDVSGYHGGEDAWILKLNTIGSIQWQKCLGGSGHEYMIQAKFYRLLTAVIS